MQLTCLLLKLNENMEGTLCVIGKLWMSYYRASGLLPTGRGRWRIWESYYQDSYFFDLILTMLQY